MSTVIYTDDRSVLNESRELDILEASLGTGVIEGMAPKPGTNAFDIDIYGGKFAIRGVVIEETAELQDEFTLTDDTQYQLFAAYFPGEAANDPLVDGLKTDLGYAGYTTGEVFYGLASQTISTGSVGSPDIVSALEGTSNALSAKYVVVLADIYVPAGEANLSGATRFNVPSRIPDVRKLQNQVNEQWQMVSDDHLFTGVFPGGTSTLEVAFNNMSILRTRPGQRWAGPGNARMDIVTVSGKDTPTDGGTYSDATKVDVDENWDFAIVAVRGSTGELEIYPFKSNDYGFVVGDEDAHQEIFGNAQSYAGDDEHPYVPDFDDVYVVGTLFNSTPPYALWSDGTTSYLADKVSGNSHYTTLTSTDYGTSVGRSDGEINIDSIITNTEKLKILGLDEAYDSAEVGSVDGAGRDIDVDAGAIDVLLTPGAITADPQNSMWRDAINIENYAADDWHSGITVISDQIGGGSISGDRYGFRHYTVFEGNITDVSADTLLAAGYRLDEESVTLHWNGADVEIQFSVGGTQLDGDDLSDAFGGAAGSVFVYIDTIGNNRLFRLNYPAGSPPLLKDYDGSASVEGYISGVTSGDIVTTATFFAPTFTTGKSVVFAQGLNVNENLSVSDGTANLNAILVQNAADFISGATFSDLVDVDADLDLDGNLDMLSGTSRNILIGDGNVDVDGDPDFNGTGLVSAHEFRGYLPQSPDQSDRLIVRPEGGSGNRAEAHFFWLDQGGAESYADIYARNLYGESLLYDAAKTSEVVWDVGKAAYKNPDDADIGTFSKESQPFPLDGNFIFLEGDSSNPVPWTWKIRIPEGSTLENLIFWVGRDGLAPSGLQHVFDITLHRARVGNDGGLDLNSVCNYSVTAGDTANANLPDFNANGFKKHTVAADPTYESIGQGYFLLIEAQVEQPYDGGGLPTNAVHLKGVSVTYTRTEPSW